MNQDGEGIERQSLTAQSSQWKSPVAYGHASSTRNSNRDGQLVVQQNREEPHPPLSYELDVLERAFTSISFYITGACSPATSLSNLKWLHGADTNVATVSSNPKGHLMQHCYEARRLAHHGQVAKAEELITSTKSSIASIIAMQYPTLLLYVMQLSLFLLSKNRHDLSSTLFRVFYEVAVTILPQQHPIVQVCYHLAAIETGNFLDYGTVVAIGVVRDFVTSMLGPFDRLAMNCRLDYILRVDYYRSPDRGEAALHALLEADNRDPAPRDDFNLIIRLAIAQTHLARGKYTEGLAMATQVIQRAETSDTKVVADHYLSEGYFALGQLYSLLGKRVEALAALAQAEEVLYESTVLRPFRMSYLFHRINMVRAAHFGGSYSQIHPLVNICFLHRLVESHTVIPATSAAERCEATKLFLPV